MKKQERMIEVTCEDCGKKRMAQSKTRLPKRCSACSLTRLKAIEGRQRKRSPP